MKKLTIVSALAAFLTASPAFAEVDRVDASTNTNPGGGAQDYLDKVAKRRAKYGNEDGLQQSTLMNGTQVSFGLGFNSFTAAGLDQGNGPYFGMSIVDTVTDNVGWELLGGFSTGSSSQTVLGTTIENSVDMFDVGLLVRAQTVLPMGGGDKALVPHFGLGPVFSSIGVTSKTPLASFDDTASALGIGLQAGADLNLGGVVIGAKFRYTLSRDVSDKFTDKDTSYMTPSMSVGWTF